MQYIGLQYSIEFVTTLLLGVYLAYDTQDTLKKYGGDNEFASLHIYIIYINIARLILTILAMLGKSRK